MKDLLRLNALLRHVIDVYVRSASAESGPPLGTVLGNMGVNASKFSKEFNDFTKNLPAYFVVRVRIFIYENRTCSFLVFIPPAGYLLNIVKFLKSIKVVHFDKLHDKNVYCIKFIDLLKLSIFKFPKLPLNSSFLIMWSTVIASDVKVAIL